MEEVKCPKCESPYTYMEGEDHVCTQCNHKWNEEELKEESLIKDMNGNVLNNGDDVIVMQSLRIQGSKDSVRKGTKVRNIRLLEDPVDGHDISARVDGFGAMNLKSEFVRKQ